MALAYQDQGIYDPMTDSYTAYPWEAAEASNFGGGWSQTLQDIAKIGASTWAQKTLVQQNQQGQQYLEGQRLALLQGGSLLNPQVLLLIGGAALLFFLVKD